MEIKNNVSGDVKSIHQEIHESIRMKKLHKYIAGLLEERNVNATVTVTVKIDVNKDEINDEFDDEEDMFDDGEDDFDDE